jgi:zinc transporter ZupT
VINDSVLTFVVTAIHRLPLTPHALGYLLYRQVGRWILAAAILVGWALGSGIPLSEEAIAVLFAFLAGGLVLNVLKEELPED